MRLSLTFQDVCAFVPVEEEGKTERITVLLPEARAPQDVVGRPERLLPHYPYLRFELDGNRPRNIRIVPDQEVIRIGNHGYWFFGNEMEFTLGPSETALELSDEFREFVAPMEALYGSSEHAQADPVLFGPKAPAQRLHSRFVINRGELASVTLCQDDGTDAEFVFESDGEFEPAGEPPNRLAHRVEFQLEMTLPEGEPSILIGRCYHGALLESVDYDGEGDVELLIGNSPLEVLTGADSEQHSPRDFHLYSRLLKRDDPERRFHPRATSQGSGVGSGLASCCSCSQLLPGS